ncbi:MAG: phosphate ABC transporter substrate-binding protein [Deltaproteobacteria bacterium]|nr:phosphate ABC transporter substrate-binding protein [Deltaproteobacteria bacterium]
MELKKALIGLSILLSFMALSCSSKSTTRAHSLTIAGSTSVQPFAEKLAEIYMEINPKVIINVQGGGSTAGIKACRQRAAQVGTSSRELHPEENDLTKIIVAWDGIAIIVHPENPIKDLTLTQIQGIFAGKIRSWSHLGGRNKPIYFVTREEGSGTRDAFENLVMKKIEISDEALVEDSNGSVREIIAHNPSAIGYISFGVVNQQVKALAINSQYPSPTTIKNRSYQLTRPFLFVVNEPCTPLAQEFISFVLSKEGQHILEKEGLVGIN